MKGELSRIIIRAFHKNPKNSDTENIPVIILKFECGLPTESYGQMMLTEWQIV